MRIWFRRAAARFECSPLAFILGLGLLMRLVVVNSRSLQYDDVFSIFLARRSLAEIVAGTAADTMPPLYYFLLHFWMLISREVWFIRLLTILISLGILALLFWLVDHWLGRQAAVWAGVITALSPLQLYHAQDIRMYALLVLGQLGYAAFFTHIWFAAEEKRRVLIWDWGGLVLCGLVAMYSHNLALFGLAAVTAFPLFTRRWKLFAQMVAAQAVVLFGALPWLIMLPGQLEKIQRAFWTPRPGPVEVIQALILFTATLPLPLVAMAIVTVLSFQILVMLILELRRRAAREAGAGFFLCLLLIPPALLFGASYLMRPVFVTRGFLVSSLAFYALVGFVVAQSWSRGIGKMILGAYALILLISLPYHYTFNSFPRSPVREAVAYLRSLAQPGDQIVHETKLSYFPAQFYAADLEQVFLPDEPGSANDTFALASQEAMKIFPQTDLAAAVGNRERVFFITYTQVFLEFEVAGESDPALDWLQVNYRLSAHKVFNDLEVFTFER